MNNATLKEIIDTKMYFDTNKVRSGNSSGSSDISLYDSENNIYIFISCKYFKNDKSKKVKKYDISDINSNIFHHSSIYTNYKIYLLVKDKKCVQQKFKKANKSSNNIVSSLSGIFDMDDLELGFKRLRDLMKNMTNNISNKPILNLRFHQELVVRKTCNLMKDSFNKKILLGCKCRSGKTYMVGGLIDRQKKYYNNLGLNYNVLILTPAPTETIPQFTSDLFDTYSNFDDFKKHYIETGEDFKNISDCKNNNNLMVVSKQLLSMAIKNAEISFLSTIGEFNLIVFDENHFGGCTKLSSDTLEKYIGANTYCLFLTATYNKPLHKWNISDNCKIFWDREDEMLCQKYDVKKLKQKHELLVDVVLNEMTNNYIIPIETILDFYKVYPKLQSIYTLFKSQHYDIIKQKIEGTKYGFSCENLLQLVKAGSKYRLKYPSEVERFLRYISGSNKEIDYQNGDYSVFNQIRYISTKNDNRTTLYNKNFTSQLWFLPYGIGMPIDDISDCLREAMLNDKILCKFEIIIINSKQNIKDIKLAVRNKEIEGKNDNKEGLIILAGNQCSLGITLPLVDVVFLMNSSLSFDKIEQMKMRCVTEAMSEYSKDYQHYKSICEEVEKKRIGFVVDLNINRVTQCIIQDAIQLRRNYSTEEAVKWYIDTNLINIDTDLFYGK